MNHSIVRGVLAAVTLVLAACSGQSSNEPGQPLFVPAVDYADFTPAAGCTADVQNATYRACIDPNALYAAAVQSATEAGNPLMVIWGFEECPYCKKFAQDEMDPDNPRTTRDFVTNTLSKKQRNGLPNKGADFQISVLHLHVRAPAGAALAERLGVTDIARERGWHRLGFYLVLLGGLALLGDGSGSPSGSGTALSDEALGVAPVYIASPFVPTEGRDIVPP